MTERSEARAAAVTGDADTIAAPPAATPTDRPPYPPARHALRDLRLAIEPRGDDRAVARMPLDAGARVAGEPAPGVLTTMIDALGGHLALAAALPDWMATSGLTLHRWATPGGPVTAEGRVVRRGRTSLVVEVTVADATATTPATATVALATLAFTVLPRRAGTLVVDRPPGGLSPLALAPEAAGDASPVAAALGFRVGPGGARVDLVPYVRNSFGALNGGVLAGLAEAAAAGTAGGGVARQLTVHYLRQATVGPVVARARPLGRTGGLGAWQVDVVDAGADDRHVATATVLVDPPAP
jgi:acyl-coenzyme A thioesterase PaaI-like protein